MHKCCTYCIYVGLNPAFYLLVSFSFFSLFDTHFFHSLVILLIFANILFFFLLNIFFFIFLIAFHFSRLHSIAHTPDISLVFSKCVHAVIHLAHCFNIFFSTSSPSIAYRKEHCSIDMHCITCYLLRNKSTKTCQLCKVQEEKELQAC